MKLRVLTPTEIVFDEEVRRLVAEGEAGSFGIRPRHADYVAALVPGLLHFVREDGKEEYAAVDRGVLVKLGGEVTVSVHSAVRGRRVDELLDVVHSRYLRLDDQERGVRTAIARLESDFLRRFMEIS